MEVVELSEIKDEKIRSLILASASARQKAYQPYSNFSVGAALQCKDGEVVTGCNVENVSYGITICAERTAIVKAVSEGLKEFSVIAVSAVSNSDFLVSPCGSCRQFLAEFNPRIPIYMHDPETGRVGITDLGHLLPNAVLPKNLKSALNMKGDLS